MNSMAGGSMHPDWYRNRNVRTKGSVGPP
jgi:hypothetical protein